MVQDIKGRLHISCGVIGEANSKHRKLNLIVLNSDICYLKSVRYVKPFLRYLYVIIYPVLYIFLYSMKSISVLLCLVK
jgi:hypothetical protein